MNLRPFPVFPARPAWLAVATGTLLLHAGFAAVETVPASEPLMQALADELARAMTLQMPDLEKPYFAQFTVEDSLVAVLHAEAGALVAESRIREREFRVAIRVGDPALDNSNFDPGAPFGSKSPLPVEDDYLALRQAIWLATDREYKSAVETLTRKRAYLRDKQMPERPADFSTAPVVVHSAPPPELDWDPAAWRANVRAMSAGFQRFASVEESSVQLIAGLQNHYLVNSEGTRLRAPDTGVLLVFSALVRAADGMRLTDGRMYVGQSAADLPSLATVRRDIEGTVAGLEILREAAVLDRYSGPVLFDGVAGAQLFYAMLAPGLAGRPDLVGEQRRAQGPDNLEYKLGTRLLPPSFQVWDDPSVARHEGQALLGHYAYDDEAVAARRVDLVTDGKLGTLCLSRAPTRKLVGSNGHARSVDGGAPRAAIANLVVEDQKGVPAAELKAELLAAARDEGLEYALRIEALQLPGVFSSRADLISYFNRAAQGGRGKLADPLVVYRVALADGRETPLRGAEFAPLELRALKHILAAGQQAHVFNHLGVGLNGAEPPVAVVAPAVVLEEVELTRIQEELEQPPLLRPPGFRD